MKEIFIAFYYVSTFLVFYIIGKFFDVTNYFKPYISDSNRLYIFIGLAIIAFLWIALQNWIRIYNLSTHISSKIIMILTPIVFLSYTFFPISEFEGIDNTDILIVIISIIATTIFYILLGFTHLIFPKKTTVKNESITIIETEEEDFITPEFKVEKPTQLSKKIVEQTSSQASLNIKNNKTIQLDIKPETTDIAEPIVASKNTQHHQINLKIQQLNYQKERLSSDTPVNNFVKSYIDKRIVQLKNQ